MGRGRLLKFDEPGGIKIAVNALKKSCGCPVNHKAPIKMTKDAFIAACLRRQRTSGSNDGVHGWRLCDKCKTGKIIRQKGQKTTIEEINIPPGITVLTDDQFAGMVAVAQSTPAIYKRPYRYEEAMMSYIIL